MARTYGEGQYGQGQYGGTALVSPIYPSARAKLARGEINLLTDDIGVVPVTDAYDLADEFVSQVTQTGGGVSLTGKSIDAANGAFKAADAATTNATGTAVAIVIYKWAGTLATSPLIAYIDQAYGLPVTLSNEPLWVTWPTAGVFIL
jgi:hypothetical protein